MSELQLKPPTKLKPGERWTPTKEALVEILRLHKLWTLVDPAGVKADLQHANLQHADLQYANLRYADLQHTDLRCADLRCANLRCAHLRYADLQHTDLRCANLRCAHLRYADLQYADLQYANLRCTDLRCADLRYADLRCAHLRYADLQHTDLRCTDLRCADLQSIKRLSWSSHYLLGEILWRAADGNESREKLAAFVSRKTGWCWDKWATFNHRERDWAISVLAPFAKDDADAPDILKHAAQQ